MEHQEVPTWHGSGGGPASEGIDIAGSATDSEAVMLDGRDETVRRNYRIKSSGTRRDQIYFRDCTDCRIVDPRIKAVRNPLIRRESNATIENSTLVTHNGTEKIKETEAMDKDFTPRGEQ